MTTYELYINDILCDLSSDEVITLLYQSPIFSSLDSIQSNRSYNIALPPTPANMRAIGQAARPDVDADAPYVRLPAALYQDGVPLFTQGFAVVTDIADTINVTLTWGNADNFQPLFDANLRDLGPQLEAAGEDYIEWNEDSAILKKGSAPSGGVVSYPSVAFWGIDFGMGLSNPKYLHPAIDVWRILYSIQQAHGITIEDYRRLYGTLELPPIVPLVSKNGDPKYNFALKTGSLHLDVNTISGSVGLPNTIWANKGYSGNDVDQAGIYKTENNRMVIDVSDVNSIRFVFTGGGVRDGAIAGNNPRFQIMAGKDSDTFDNYVVIYDTEATYTMSEIDQMFDVTAFDYIAIRVTRYEWQSNTQSINSIVGNIYIWGDYDIEVIFPGPFPIAPNLPDISQGDFILAMMNMQGLFAYADKDNPNTIKLISIDDIIANVQKNDIIDWSDRVILNDIHRVDIPDASVFTIDDLAQSNILDYDNDDDVKTDTHGTITIRNENIEKEAELVELPFSASENATTGGVNCAVVPIYEDDGKGGANYSKCSPRILAWKDDQAYNSSAICTGRFDPWMKFGGENGIVKTRYASYQKVVDRLRIITIRAKLTALDLYNLDYTKPVYIAQFGQIFAIYSVETGEDGICDCQLLKLKVDGVVPAHYYLYLDGQNADQSKTDITSAGTTITYSVQSNGTPYVVSKDSRLTVTLQTAEDGTMLLTIKVPQNTSDADIDYEPVILGVGEAYWVNRKVSISQLRAGYGVNVVNNTESRIVTSSTQIAWEYIVLPVGPAKQGDKFALSIGEIKVLKGEPTGFQVRLTYGDSPRPINVILTKDNRTCLFTAHADNDNYRLVIYAGIGGQTNGNSVQYNHIMLVRGNTPQLEWAPSIADQEAEYYLALDGINGDIPINIEAAAKQNRVSWSSNRTPQILSYSGDAVALAEVDAYAVNIYSYANTTSEQRTGQVTVYLKEAPSIERKIVVIQEAAAAERMVIIDVHACGVAAGENVELKFELTTSWLGWFDVLDDLTVRVSFNELSSMMGQELADHVGERFYIEASNNGECWFGPVPASGNIEAELV